MTTPVPPIACIVGRSPVRLYGLDGAQRLERQLRAAGLPQVMRNGDALPADGSVQLVRGDYLFDDRTLRDLAASPDTVLSVSDRHGTRIVAAHVAAKWAEAARALLADARPAAGDSRRHGAVAEQPIVRLPRQAAQDRAPRPPADQRRPRRTPSVRGFLRA